MNSTSGFSVTLDVGKKIIELASKDTQARRVSLNYLRELQHAVKEKRKQIRSYFLTVDALSHQYERRIYSSRQLASRLQADFAKLDTHHSRFLQQKEQQQQQLKALEEKLQQSRDYAQQRRDKKARREREYNHFYFLPVVNIQYRRKYLRARDKNADAEQQVSDIRSQLDACQDAVREIGRSIGQQLKVHEEAKQQQKDAEDEMCRLQKQLSHLHDGQRFWGQFDSNQVTMFLEASEHIVHALKNDHCPEEHWAKSFQMSCLEYGDSEQHGDKRWSGLQVEFDCARCHEFITGWPSTDKVRTTDLLCGDCYQNTRASQIIEKKINVFGQKLGLDRTENRRQSASARHSHTPILNDARPMVKKMLKNVFVSPNTATRKRNDDNSIHSTLFTYIHI